MFARINFEMVVFYYRTKLELTKDMRVCWLKRDKIDTNGYCTKQRQK